MSVKESDIRFSGSANMPDADGQLTGGGLDKAIGIVFNDVDPTGNIQIVSSNVADTAQTVTVTGRNPAGEIITEGKVLNGLTPVPMTTETSWERILKGFKSATTVGDVAIEEVTAEYSEAAVGGAAETPTVMAYVDLGAGASGVDDAYKNKVLRFASGTGAGQIRRVLQYVGAIQRAYVNYDWLTVPDGTSVVEIRDGMLFERNPDEVMEVRRPFYLATAEPQGGSPLIYHEKIFVRNGHATLTLTTAQIIELADPTGQVDFGLESTLDGSDSTTDRLVAPAGITFDDAPKAVANGGNHTAGAAQGTWLRLSRAAGAAAFKSTYTLREEGSTT